MSLFRPTPPGNWSLFFSAHAMLTREEESDETDELLQASWAIWQEGVPGGDTPCTVTRGFPALRAARQILPDLRDFPQIFTDPLEAVDRLASFAALLERVRGAIAAEKRQAAHSRFLRPSQGFDRFRVSDSDVRAVHGDWAPAVSEALRVYRTPRLDTPIPGYLEDFNVFRHAEGIVDRARLLHAAVTETAAAVAFLDVDHLEQHHAAYEASELELRTASGIDAHHWRTLRLLQFRVEGHAERLDRPDVDRETIGDIQQDLWEHDLDLRDAVLDARSEGVESELTACSAYFDLLEAVQLLRLDLDRHPAKAPGWKPRPLDLTMPDVVAQYRAESLDTVSDCLALAREALDRAGDATQHDSFFRSFSREEDAKLPETLRMLHARLQIENERQGPTFVTIRMEMAQKQLPAVAADLERTLGITDAAPRDAPAAGFAALAPDEFEHAIAALLRANGCAAERNGGTGDLGADVVATTPRGSKIVVQCKRYDPRRPVGSPDMQRFAGTVFAVHRADLALFVTTSTFTDAAASFAGEVGITLIDGIRLRAWATGTYDPTEGI
ncbi:Restriction endonuclease [Streptacidiphilus jiangxiensis]|uniref:Restriction endonuclease n=1 Tax=Streptacidiphilus jiangxiensis TaxID=235985 RepID=A0A1H7WU46_STRJI|nr:Restriction endonuclease [Streptacidiphilus jiangxiensis]